MAITPTYPGVYVEELPSAVRTIVGVQTAITAFVGYTKRGPADAPTRVQRFGDYERTFGPLDPDSPVGYAVQQFFQNGGGEAWIVRVAQGAARARLDLRGTAGTTVLVLEARSSGIWANGMAITVDFDTVNPASLFNVSIASGEVSEAHRNLSMDSLSATYAVAAINANSNLVRATRPAAVTVPAATVGTSLSAIRTLASVFPALAAGSTHRVMMSVNGSASLEVTFDVPATAAGTDTVRYDQIATAIASAASNNGLAMTGAGAAVTGGQQMTFTSGTGGERSSVHITTAGADPAAAILGLGTANGGVERDAAASIRPIETGATGSAIGTLPAPSTTARSVTVQLHNNASLAGAALATAVVSFTLPADRSATPEDARTALEQALRRAADDPANALMAPALAGARVRFYGGVLHITPGGGPDTMFRFAAAGADTMHQTLGLDYAVTQVNLASYSPGFTGPLLGLGATVRGSDGQLPTNPAVFIGNEVDKTGINALIDVDLVNILCVPDQSDFAVLSAAVTWCERNRCFFIADMPANIRTPAAAEAWIRDPARHPTSNYAAAYFPRIVAPDPQQNYQPRAMSPSGAVAGLYARTDTTRGVWKAPAGTDATLREVLGTDYLLTDGENGTLNPLGLNSLRSLPIYGNLVWGARTLEGSDQAASQWKYIPVRRIALFIEESLFRGTQWVVFEPNDEPLWMQIRLNVGAFMQSLFRQGAFQGASPRDAYLVKCDSETTTQDDINRGIVNIVVGFAPLKPAEFVILKLTQLAGQVEV